MKILISPAKSLNLSTKIPEDIAVSNPLLANESLLVKDVLQKQTPKQLQQIMNISDKLADLNWQRHQCFDSDEYLRPAIFMFNGEVYTGLSPYTINSKHFYILQQSVRILSGLYGILRPFDQIHPYRLEMKTNLTVKTSNNLYEFWKKKSTDLLRKHLHKDELLVNLASEEYASSIDFKNINNSVIKPIFKDFKEDKYKVISFYAKKTRGLMTRYLIENKVNTLQGVLEFNVEGYSYNKNETKNKNQPVFVRG